MHRLDKYWPGSQKKIQKPRAVTKLFTVTPSSGNIGPYHCSSTIFAPASTSKVEPAPDTKNWILLRYLTKLDLQWDHWCLSWAWGILKHSGRSGQIFPSFCTQKHKGFFSHNFKAFKAYVIHKMSFFKVSKLSNTLECSRLHLIEAPREAAWLILWHSTHLKGLIDLYSESWVVTYDPEPYLFHFHRNCIAKDKCPIWRLGSHFKLERSEIKVVRD